MKILFVIESLTEGGKERRLVELMKALKKESDLEFNLVVMSYDVHYKEVFDLGIDINYLIRKRRKDLTIYKNLYRLCKNNRPDIIHCWDTMTAVYIVPVCKFLKIKFVNGIVMDAPEKRSICNKFWLRAKLTFPFSDAIVGNSKAGIKAYSAPKGKSHVIYNGFNFKRISHLIPKEIIRNQLNISTKYIIGMVATFSDFKDYPTYFCAAKLLLNKRNDITFLAIGKNTDSVSSKKLIDNNFASYFRLLGEKFDVESFINAMDICILSTFTEGISNSILEYMALEKPVIATSGGGTCEILEDNVTGFLVSQSNPNEIADKVEFFLNDPELMTKMGNNGKERILRVFSIDKMAGEFISVYKLLLSA